MTRQQSIEKSSGVLRGAVAAVVGTAAVWGLNRLRNRVEFSRVNRHAVAEKPVEVVNQLSTAYQADLRSVLAAYMQYPDGATVADARDLLPKDRVGRRARRHTAVAAQTLRTMGLLCPVVYEDAEKKLGVTPECVGDITSGDILLPNLLTRCAELAGYQNPAEIPTHRQVVQEIQQAHTY